MALNPFCGWAASTLALYFLNKGSKSGSDSSSIEPNDLNVTETKIGTPIPAIMGTCLIKSPLTIYYGDFRAEAYTETYAAHAKFNAWPMVFALIAQYIAAAISGHQVSPGKVTSQGTGYHGVQVHSSGVSSGATFKDDLVGPLINSLFMWLLSWLINGRNLKTTMQKGFKYYLGYQQLLCWSGPDAKLKKIYMNEKLVWEGSASAKEQNGAAFVISIDDGQLFGGPDEGGGFSGEIHVYFGGANQRPDSWMVNRMKEGSIQENLRGLTPAYRPFISVVVPTAYVGKQATVPTMWYEIENIPNQLGLGAIGEDANPAEVFYETHVNRDWGLAESEELLNIDALKEIGAVLREERIGVSVPVTSKITAGQLIDSILEHINAVKYIEPKDARLTYRLIRDDIEQYQMDGDEETHDTGGDSADLKEMFLLNESNVSRITFSRLDWRETVSEISASFTDRSALYETGTLSDTDPANVEINRGIVTAKSYAFPYFTNAENALWAAKRELMQQGYPLAAISVEGNRALYTLRLGDLCMLDFPAYGIKHMLCRVTDVNLGNFIDGVIRLELIEDIFSLAKTDFGFSDSTQWKPEPVYPTGAQLFNYLELPYEIMQVKDTYVFALAARPDLKTQTWTIWRKRAGADFETTNTMSKWTTTARLVYDYDEFGPAEDMTGIEIIDLGGVEDLRFRTLGGSETDILSARRGGKLLMMGDELMAWSSLMQMPNGNWRLRGIIRGVYDTVPQAHGNGEIIYFFESGHYANVTTGGPVCREGHTVDEAYNITTGTVDGQEDFDAGKTQKLLTVRRAERPSPPGKIRMDAHLLNDSVSAEKIAGDLTVRWFPRNKQYGYGCVSQDDEKDYWTDADFTPPDGLEYVVNVYAGADQIKTVTTADTAFHYDWADRAGDGTDLSGLQAETRLEIYAKLNGLLSYQAHMRTFLWMIPIFVNAAVDEIAANQCLAGWCDSDEIVVPENTASPVQYIKYAQMPILLLGRRILAPAPNAVVGYNGVYIVPDGRILCVENANEYRVERLKKGFALKTKFKENNLAPSEKILQWDGAQFIEMT